MLTRLTLHDTISLPRHAAVALFGDRARVAPVFGAALRLAPSEVGYSLELDLRPPLASTHTLLLGLQL
jgi:hypothetical protein